jgi:rfaE bifunctional protein kinase chain/domain
MDSKTKILTLDDLKTLSSDVRRSCERIAFCQGHFNVIHPGHLRFLQHAKSLGGCLVVAIHGTDHLPEEFQNQYFSEQERLAGVSALNLVDYVVLLTGDVTVETVIQSLKPDFYVLGKEFQHERADEVLKPIEILRVVGGQTVYHSGDVYSGRYSTHYAREKIDPDRVFQFYAACAKQAVDLGHLKEKLDDFSKCRLLVIGDLIIDSYVSCEAVGMSSEAPLIVAKELETENFLGGAGIVAAHVRALGASCDYLSVVGQDDVAALAAEKLEQAGVTAHLITDESRPTTFKTRYLVGNQKVFRLSRLKAHPLLPQVEARLIDELERVVANYQGIIVSDFNYGVLTERVIDTLTRLARDHSLILAADLQCSSQIGDIRKFRGYDLLCPNEREARISLHNQDAGLEWVANELLDTTQTKNLILKLGSAGFLAYARSGTPFRSQHFPALIANPLDVVGAGDSLLAMATTGLCCGLDIMESAALGACVAALAVQTMGNVPVQGEVLKDFLQGMN